jgi:hypothetical protein
MLVLQMNEEAVKMDIKYTEKGPKGKTCTECQFFEATDGGMGKCFGHEVLAKGGCNMFTPKK